MWHCDGCDEHYPTSQHECPTCSAVDYEVNDAPTVEPIMSVPPLRDPTLMRQRWEILREAERRARQSLHTFAAGVLT